MSSETRFIALKRFLIGLFGVVALSLAAGGYWFYNHETRAIRNEKYGELQAIAGLKVNQIVRWRQEQLADARLNSGGIIGSWVIQWLKTPNDASLKADILAQLQMVRDIDGLDNVILAGTEGRILLSPNPRLNELEVDAKQLIAQAVSSRGGVFGDLFRCPVCHEVHLDVAAPILDADGRPAAVLILRVDPDAYLYPLVQSWPTPSRSAETLLIRKEGSDALFLNVLRHRPDSALTLRIPLSSTEIPAAQAVRGASGLFEGRDYRGVNVLADVRPVPDSPWFMVAKVDSDEILAEAKYRGRVIMIFAALSILMTGAVAALVFNRRERHLYRNLFRAERGRRGTEQEIRATLYGIGDGVIATDTAGRVRRMNPQAEQMTGWREAEALNKPLEQVFRIISEDTRADVENPVQRVIREGSVIGLANRTLLIARDGTERPIADSGAPIREEEGRIAGVVLVFRDQTKQRRAETLLRREIVAAQQYLDIAGVMMLALDRSGNVILVNKKGCEILGYREEEILGKNWFDNFLAAGERDKVRSVFHRIIAGEAAMDEYVENPVLHRAGGERLIAWHNAIVRGEEGDVVATLSSGEDITERKRAEEVLRRRANELNTIIESTVDGILVIDSEGRVLHANSRFAEMWRIPRTLISSGDDRALLAFVLDQLVAPEKFLAKVQRLYRVDQIDEDVLHFKDGRIFERFSSPLSEEGNLFGRLWIFRDVTERKRAEDELRKLSMAVQQSTASVVITDPQGNIEYVNAKFTESTGYTLEEVRGRNPRILKSGETSSREYRSLWETITSGGEWRGAFHNRRKNGTLFWERASISPIRDDSGAITHFVGVKEDITVQKALEEQLRQAQKMESVGRLAGGVAHDFNNMLGVITGHAEMALPGVDTSTPLYTNLQEILKATRRSADLTRQLLAFARKQTVNPEVLDLNEIISGMLSMLQRLIGENVKLDWRPGPELWPVEMDPVQVDQILANLAINARDAIASVGTVTVETANVVFDEAYCRSHMSFVPGEYVLLEVGDTGAGMDKGTLEHIFEPFFTTKEAGKGTGLGLATVYGIVKQNNGFIIVHSEPGRGTKFSIYLSRARSQMARVKTAVEQRIASGTETVLLVEDEEAILKLGKTILERYGYTVLAAQTPGEALALAERHEGRIHILVSDVVMPEMNGKELLEKILVLRPGLKSLFMSGYTANVIVHQGVLEEGVNFLQKPFSIKSLAQKVRGVLDGK